VNWAGKRQGGRLWPAVLVVSVLALTSGLAQLGRDHAVVERSPVAATALSWPSASAPTPNARGAPPATTSTKSGGPSSGWPTRKAGPQREPHGTGPGLPYLLRIPRLELTMPIIATTVNKTGQMALPERPTEIGWYAYGPPPGAEEGSAVLAGHIDSREYGVGPLARLRRLSTGDKIIIESRGDRLTFRVDSVRQISKRAVPLAEVFDRSGLPRLRIVTCGGPYLPSRGGYQDNLIVSATGQ
jgi:LPXTG-site transpeptidase (sortase) family protein